MARNGRGAISKAPRVAVINQPLDVSTSDSGQKFLPPRDCSTGLRFEVLLYCVALTHLFLQNFNIYRWNFHSCNTSLLALSVFFLLLKRIGLKYGLTLRKSADEERHFWSEAPRMVLLSTGLLIVLYYAASLFFSTPTKKFLFLFYPLIVYILLASGPLERTVRFHPGDNAALMLNTILYSTFEITYFAGFLPLSFLEYDKIYYDRNRCLLIMAYLAVDVFALLCCNTLSIFYTRFFLEARLAACWLLCDMQPDAPEWAKGEVYLPGAVVTHNGRCYQMVGSHALSEPGREGSSVLMFLFLNRADGPHRCLVTLLGLVAASQLYAVFHSAHYVVYFELMLVSSVCCWYCLSTRRKNLDELETLLPATCSSPAADGEKV